MTNCGLVSLVGAGPGDAELITVKGLRRLRKADVVVYDALVSDELLRECRPAAELIYVGKRAGGERRSQDSINALLIEKASAGRRVVRLKGGDAFVFGRGGEEAEALQAAGIPWEVIPGVTSAVSVPACAGIPVTHRAIASSFAVVTGHEAPTKEEPRINWRALAEGVDTLVVLMSLGRLATIVEQLIAYGRSANTPAAVISEGATPRQTTVVATLGTIAAAVRDARVAAPAMLVVGEVVRFRERLGYPTDRPVAEHGANGHRPSLAPDE